MHKTENCWDGANAANDPRKKKRELTIPTNKIGEQPVPTPSSQPKTEIAAPTIWGKSRREGVHDRGPPKQV